MRRNERFQKLIMLIACASKHKGEEATQLARVVGIPAEELRESINTLNLCGRPPFNPDDLIEIWIDDQDRVRVEFDQSLGRPLRLTEQESVAISIALRSLADAGAGPLSELATGALTKLRAALSEKADGGGGLARQFAIQAEDRNHEARFRVIARALDEHRALEIAYYTASRDDLTTRVVQPYALIQFLGAWYVVGHDSRRDAVRVFKLERIREAHPTDITFVVPTDFDARQYADAGLLVGAKSKARIRFGRRWAQAIRDEWEPEQIESLPEGAVVLTIDFGNAEWLCSWALSYAPDVEILEPRELRAAVLDRCRSALAHY